MNTKILLITSLLLGASFNAIAEDRREREDRDIVQGFKDFCNKHEDQAPCPDIKEHLKAGGSDRDIVEALKKDVAKSYKKDSVTREDLKKWVEDHKNEAK
jgi:hypothetical protein